MDHTWLNDMHERQVEAEKEAARIEYWNRVEGVFIADRFPDDEGTIRHEAR